MPSPIDYALFAANSYAVSTDVVSTKNRIPIPDGWCILTASEISGNTGIDNATGFLARAYKNDSTGEIVISYGGTTYEPGMATRDWTEGNLPGATGVGLAEQIVDAAKFYLDVLNASVAAGNAHPTLTFTGHSLGGGLAALMAVYFGREASTFDQAPFALSATSLSIVDELRSRLLEMNYTLPAEFEGYNPATGLTSRQALVSQTYLAGEALQYINNPFYAAVIATALAGPAGGILTAALGSTISPIAGATTEVDAGDGSLSDAVQRHYMPLLLAAMQSYKFKQASKNNPELLQQLFQSVLYYNQNDTDHRNFLNLMVQQQAAGNRPLDALAGDIAKFTGALDPVANGVTGADATLRNALFALAIDLYYGAAENAIGTANQPIESVFNSVGGGIQFAPDPARSAEYGESLTKVMQELALYFPQVGSELTPDADRFTLSTTGGVIAPAIADDKRDLMLGSAKLDNLQGGGGNDTLIGLGGADTLKGGAGDDTYLFNPGDGHDTIDDSGGDGTIKVGGNTLAGADTASYLAPGAGNRRQWQDASGTRYTLIDGSLQDGGTLQISGGLLDANDALTIKHYKNGELGLTFAADKKLALQTGHPANPFRTVGYEPPANPNTALAEGHGKTLTLALNAPANAGDTVTLDLAGADNDAFAGIFGDEQISFSGGTVQITLAEGQTQIAFSLVNTGNIDADAALNLNATVTPVEGDRIRAGGIVLNSASILTRHQLDGYRLSCPIQAANDEGRMAA